MTTHAPPCEKSVELVCHMPLVNRSRRTSERYASGVGPELLFGQRKPRERRGLPLHLTYRQSCRVCGSRELTPVIDLGEQFLQGSFYKPGQPKPPLRKLPMR